ncbi:MAG: bis(5'-nucleosyl)-tetraphosphatase (symmetrical) YqeK [Oscillospiraceae bacterium]|nr:bis(5'-nucleosyl)-tetraphosphatase (symmetrical) YqeK [Oscillospiraceae bacterium]
MRLALRYGSDPAEAAEAAILHDITKKLSHPEQLEMCRHYGLANDAIELQSPALMHAKTGAAFSRDLFGVPDRIYDAILYHTTGRPKMTLLEKIIYLADFIEPTRDFPGVEPLRELCYKDINQGMELGLRMSLEHIRSGGEEPYITTRKAQEYYEKLIAENKGETLC